MFWTVEKLEKRIEELRELRYRDAIALEDWAFAVDEDRTVGIHPPEAFEPERIVGKGDRWSGRDLYVWLRRQVTLPPQWAGRTIVGLFDFGETGPGHNSGFESLLFVGGRPYQGVDSNHREVFFTAPAADMSDQALWHPLAAGDTLDLCFRLWSGLEGGGVRREQHHEIRRAELAWLDGPSDDLYYTAKAVLDTVKQLGEDRIERHELLKALDRAFLLVDWSRPGSDAFYDSVAEAGAKLARDFEALKQKHPVIVRCIGHTHIDVAWLWRLVHTREKAARSFSTVLRLMERYPEYIFLQTQPQLYDYIKQDYPEIYAQMKTRIAEKRWEAGGAMWLEADCNLTSGESLVRQLLYGTRFLKEEFGVECRYLWLPDVFGYSWALPQILRKSGIDTFMTTKISWSQYNRMPHDTFRWRGIDGSEVLTHFVTTPEVPGTDVWWYTYNGFTDAFAVKGIWDKYRDKEINNELLLSYGYGDGGGGVNRDMLEMRRRMEEMPGIPSAVPGRADDFFDRLQETVRDTDRYVHTWDGELYLEYHRGTYTSQGYNKRMNRKLELLYREAEWLQALARAETGAWPAAAEDGGLREGWRILLRNQFHDIIPGSSIPEVYEDSRVEYAEAEAIARGAWSDAAEALGAATGTNGGPEPAAGDADRLLSGELAAQGGLPGAKTHAEPASFTVWNSAGFARADAVLIPAEAAEGDGIWTDGEGRPLTAQRGTRGWLVRPAPLPSLGAGAVIWRPSAEGEAAVDVGGLQAASPFALEGTRFTTPHYELTFNEAGQISRLFDKQAGREVLAAGACGNVFQLFEDKPKMFEAWDIDLFYQEKQRDIASLARFELVESGPLAATLRLEWTFGESRIAQRLTAYVDSRRIDFETAVDWQERQQLLKVAFPVSVRSTEATYDIQYGNVKRPTHWNTSWDYARFETVGHQWVDLSERGYGVSLLNDCKYGHDIKDNVIRLTLLKAANDPDPGADRGRHVFTYSLLPHAGDWEAGRTRQEAWQLNNPLVWSAGLSPAAGKSLLRADAEAVHFDAVKEAEDGGALIVRLHEATGASVRVALESDYEIAAWQECDLMERPLGPQAPWADVALYLAPYEIRTLRLALR